VQKERSQVCTKKNMSVREVGISGWMYKGWREEELKFARSHLTSIEINGTLYNLQRPITFQRWYDITPKNFIFSVNVSRFVTHLKRLKHIEIPLENFYSSGLLALNEKLGPIRSHYDETSIHDAFIFSA
jgi:uncharacterized protein YecE (DUF72 family)